MLLRVGFVLLFLCPLVAARDGNLTVKEANNLCLGLTGRDGRFCQQFCYTLNCVSQAPNYNVVCSGFLRSILRFTGQYPPCVTITNQGSDFYVAELPNAACMGTFGITLANPGLTQISAIVQHLATKISTSVTMVAKAVRTIEFPCRGINVTTTSYVPVYRVTSSDDVVVYAFDPFTRNGSSADASLILPVQALGTSYRVASYRHDGTNYGQSTFGVVATQNDTLIELADSTGALDQFLVLQQGQLYQRVQTNVLTGWSINANKPVAVFSGSTCTAVGTGYYGCDMLYEQTLPISALTSTYAVCPTLARPAGCTGNLCAPDLFQYIATEDNTIISFSDQLTLKIFLSAGKNGERTTAVPHVINSNKPIYVNRLLISSDSGYPTAGIGDPSLVVVPPIGQYLTQYIFLAPPGYSYHSISVSGPIGTHIVIDGTPVGVLQCLLSNQAGLVGTTIFCCQRFTVTEGKHIISGDRPFGLTITGYGDYISYAYVGGIGLSSFN